MILNGKFVLISVQDRVGNDGKTYFNANIESEEGQVMRVSVDNDVASSLNQKYQQYLGFFDVGTYNGSIYMRLKGAELVKK